MKRLITTSCALFLFLMTNVVITSCRQDDDDNSQVNTVSAVTNIATSGTWKISQYNDSGTDKTAQFNGYNFVFGGNGVLTANNGTNTVTGNWSVTDSNSNDDSPSDLDFNIVFGSPANFAELSDDWDIASKSNTVISLIDVSGGNGGTDVLTFTKN